jgi:hypothetical protein
VPSLFAEINDNVLRAAPLLIGFAAVVVLVPLLFPSDRSGSGTSVVLWGLLSYYLHRTVLFDLKFNLWGKARTRNGEPVPDEAIGWFLFLYLIFVAVTFIPAVIVAFKFADPTRVTAEHFVLVVLLAAAPLMWVFLMLFGTLFPAVAARESPSPLTALRAARRTWWRVGLQLLLLPGLYGVASLFVVGQAFVWMEGAGLSQPVVLAADVLLTAISMVGQVLTVTILVRAYRSSWHAPAQGQAQSAEA